LYDKSCERCGRNAILFKIKLTLTKKRVIRLTIFLLQDNKLIKIPQKFNLSTILTTKILITEQEYKVNAIFYYSLNIEQGYYASMCREERS